MCDRCYNKAVFFVITRQDGDEQEHTLCKECADELREYRFHAGYDVILCRELYLRPYV